MKLTCNGKTIECGNEGVLTILPSDRLVYAFFGGNDLFDLGFTYADLTNHNLTLEHNGFKVEFVCRKENEARLIREFMAEMKCSESAATHFLRKHNFNYGMAKRYLEMQRTEKFVPKPCGEIILGGPPTYCNLEPLTPEAVDAAFKGVLKNCFPALPSKPLMAKDEPDFDKLMPKTAAFQAQFRTTTEHPIQTTIMNNFCNCSYPTCDHVSQTSGTCGQCGKLVNHTGQDETFTELSPVYAASLRMIEACLCPEALKAYHEGRLCMSNADTLCKWPHEEQMKRLKAALEQEPSVFVPRNVTSKPWRSISEFMIGGKSA